MRVVMHVDLDSFYASVEEQRRPELRGRLVVVCMYSGRSAVSGAVATANYAARAAGIRAGMPIAQAQRAAPGAAFLPADLQYYREISARIMQLLSCHADSFEQRSIDEAYLEVSSRSFADAAQLAKDIKKEIAESEGISCSIGIAPNKLVAKMASRYQKPDGLTIVEQGNVAVFISPMDVGRIPGIGPKTESALDEMGVTTIGQLAQCSIKRLEAIFGRNKARFLHDAAHGIDLTPVLQEERTQVSRIVTLKEDTRNLRVVGGAVAQLSRLVHEKLGVQKFRTVSVLFITTSLETLSRSATTREYTNSLRVIGQQAAKLAEEFLAENPQALLRRIGVRVANLEEAKTQRTLESYR